MLKPKQTILTQPFFSLTNTGCNTITDVLESYIKTETLSVIFQRYKSFTEFGSLANVFIWVRLRIFLYQMDQAFFQHGLKTSLDTQDCQLWLKQPVYSSVPFLSSWVKLRSKHFIFTNRIYCVICKGGKKNNTVPSCPLSLIKTQLYRRATLITSFFSLAVSWNVEFSLKQIKNGEIGSFSKDHCASKGINVRRG